MSLQDRLGINLAAQRAQIRTMAEQALVLLTTVWESDPRPGGRGRRLFKERHWQDELGITSRWRGDWEPLREHMLMDAGNYGEPSGMNAYDATQVSAVTGESRNNYSGFGNVVSYRIGIACHDARLLVNKDTCSCSRVLGRKSGDRESLYGDAEVEASSSGSSKTPVMQDNSNSATAFANPWMWCYGWNLLLFSDDSLLTRERCRCTEAANGHSALISTMDRLHADGLIDSTWGYGRVGFAFDPGGYTPQ